MRTWPDFSVTNPLAGQGLELTNPCHWLTIFIETHYLDVTLCRCPNYAKFGNIKTIFFFCVCFKGTSDL